MVSKGLSCCLVPVAIDKLTEKAQVSEDGTMVCLQHNTHSPQITADQNTHTLQPQTAGDQHKRSLQSADTNTSGIAGASDTESNSGRDNEVRALIGETHEPSSLESNPWGNDLVNYEHVSGQNIYRMQLLSDMIL